ncbi:DUF4433 domain-containing protein [Mucilaginibacter litoreus]|uniref:DUF4433 domain-containing protein n=1 Tax=Mucilaginibacter litoreus TaxID=1048221 RepID=A0ABW3AWI8_9SPHI
MPEILIDKIWLYRVVHIENVAHILGNGLTTKSHEKADPNYMNIGDSKLVKQRSDYPVGVIPPGGVLGDYVPFYLGPLSPMLLNIKTGHRGITKRPQTEIVYLCCNLQFVIHHCNEWCFTDGHAKDALTSFYNDLNFLDQIDWNLVKERYWKNTEEYTDKMRRKQAEFLVKHEVPTSCISHIIVYDAEASTSIQKLIDELNLNIKVWINPKGRFYY